MRPLKLHLLKLATYPLLIIALSSCGKEIGRMPFTQTDVITESRADTLPDFPSKIKTISLDLKKGDNLGLWTDFNIKYEGDLAMEYRIMVIRDGKDTIDRFTADPFNVNVRTNSVRSNMNGKKSDRYMGKMGKFDVKSDGNYQFQAVLWHSDNPTVELKQADLVFKK